MRGLWGGLGLLLSACSFVEMRSDSSLSYQGGGMDPAVWDAIRAGETDRQWLLRHIGPPAQVDQLGQGKEVYHYPYQRQDYQRTRVFLIYNNQESTTQLLKQLVLLQNGVVVERWQEPEPLPPQPTEEPAAPAVTEPPTTPEAEVVTPDAAALQQQAEQKASGLAP